MGIIHFLNVKEGDCELIQHPNGHNTVIDISNGNEIRDLIEDRKVKGNFNQKENPENPIEYLSNRISTIFRFISTHPDMDHMDGIENLFNNFKVINFWDTENNKTIEAKEFGQYKKSDWDYYQKIRKGSSTKVLHLYAGQVGKYYNQDEAGESGADGLYILAPTKELVDEANKTKEYNYCSYVILYKANGKKIIFAGDSGEKTWDYILANHKNEVSNVDLLVAPHHGRKSGGNSTYLEILKPKLTLFGNAKSEHLDYASWNNKGLEFITNNQAGSIVVNTGGKEGMEVYVTNEKYAKQKNPHSNYNEIFCAWYLKNI